MDEETNSLIDDETEEDQLPANSPTETEYECDDQSNPPTFSPGELYAEEGAAYDPNPRKRTRTGKMPAGLARYWRAYDMKHAHGRSHRRKMDPRHRGKRSRSQTRTVPGPVRYRYHPAKIQYKTRTVPGPVRYRRRKGIFDPAINFGGASGARSFWGALLQPPVTALGGIIHGGVVTRYPSLAKGIKVGNNAVGLLGLGVGAIGAIWDWATGGNSMLGNAANAFGSGFFSEAINVPQVERVVTVPTQHAFMNAAMNQRGRTGGGYSVALPWYPATQAGTF